MRKAELEILKQQLAMQMEQLRIDGEDSERRIMEIANTSQEMLKKEYERQQQEKIEDQIKAEENEKAACSGKGERRRREC